jgi:hypothetical protein
MLFTKQSDQTGWFTGLTVQLILEKDQAVQFNLLPTSLSKNDYQLSLLNGEDKQRVLKEIEMYSSIIADKNKLQNAWAELIEKRSSQYLYNFSAVPAMPGRYIKSIVRRLGLVDKFLPKKYLAGIINYICCEAHLDIAKEVLKKNIQKK